MSCVCCGPQVLCLRRQLQLLLVRHAEASEAAAAAAGALDELQKQQHSALHDVEVQLRLKQGQVGGAMHQGQAPTRSLASDQRLMVLAKCGVACLHCVLAVAPCAAHQPYALRGPEWRTVLCTSTQRNNH